MNPNTYNMNLKAVMDAEQTALNDMLDRGNKSLWITTYVKNRTGNYVAVIDVRCSSWYDKRNNTRAQRFFYRINGNPATYAAVGEHVVYAADLDPEQEPEWCWPMSVQRRAAHDQRSA